ncbi:MAG: RNA polymerase sigma factor, partial [Clostridiales bacterium]|nr:RNA polymerase sigma factor [Clostridiales bacterium]
MENIITDLVKQAKTGDKSAVAELFTRTNEAMYRYARRLLGEEDARDALQNSYIKMIQSLETLREDAAFTGWLRTIVRNECLAVCRAQGREVFPETPETVFDRIEELDQDFLPADAAENRELCNQVSACIDTLPAVQREALLLYYYEDCKIADIAQLTESNENTVKYRLCQARRRLKEQFVQDGYTVSGAASALAMRDVWAALAESQALGQVARERMLTAVLSEAAVQFGTGSAAAGGGFLARLAAAPLAVKLVAGIGCAALLGAGSYRAVQNGRPEDFTRADQAGTSQSAGADAAGDLSDEDETTGLEEEYAPAIQLENTG